MGIKTTTARSVTRKTKQKSMPARRLQETVLHLRAADLDQSSCLRANKTRKRKRQATAASDLCCPALPRDPLPVFLPVENDEATTNPLLQPGVAGARGASKVDGESRDVCLFHLV